MLRRTAVLWCLAIIALAGCTSAKTPAPGSSASAMPSPAASPTVSPSPPVSPTPAATASPVPPPPGSAALSVTFISLTQAWVLAKAGAATVVLHTLDRGAHWNQVGTIPTTTGSASGTMSRIRFADAKDGWVFSPGLYATHDGGVTWRSVALPGQGEVADLEASGGTAWAIVDPPCPGTQASCNTPGSLYRTPVTVDTWSAVPGVSLPPGGGVLGLQQGAVYALNGTVLLHSANGTTFSALPSPCPTGFSMSTFAASSATALAVLCTGNAGAGSSTKEVFVSADAGQTYHQIANAPQGGQPVGLASGSPTTIAMAAASGASWIYLTTGAATAWTTPLTFSDGGAGWADLGFTDALHGVVIHGPQVAGLGTVYLTNNGGASWYPVTLAA